MNTTSLMAIGLALTLVILGIYFSEPSVYNGLSVSTFFLNRAKSADPLTVYLAVFVVTIIGNASIFIAIPYPLAILYALASGVDLAILIVVASAAAAIGELSSYMVGALGRKIKEEYKDFYDRLSSLLERNRKKVYLIVFLMAATPLPDDLILIPLGLARFGLLKSFVPCFLGKLVLIFILVVFSEFFVRTTTSSSVLLDLLTLWFIIGMIYVAKKGSEETMKRHVEALIG